MDVKFDFSDVNKFFDRGKREVKEVMKDVGEQSVDYAKKNGSYHNRTGDLRRSNSFEVVDDGLELRNSANYASFVESKGFEVLASAALEAETKLKELIK